MAVPDLSYPPVSVVCPSMPIAHDSPAGGCFSGGASYPVVALACLVWIFILLGPLSLSPSNLLSFPSSTQTLNRSILSQPSVPPILRLSSSPSSLSSHHPSSLPSSSSFNPSSSCPLPTPTAFSVRVPRRFSRVPFAFFQSPVPTSFCRRCNPVSDPIICNSRRTRHVLLCDVISEPAPSRLQRKQTSSTATSRVHFVLDHYFEADADPSPAPLADDDQTIFLVTLAASSTSSRPWVSHAQHAAEVGDGLCLSASSLFAMEADELTPMQDEPGMAFTNLSSPIASVKQLPIYCSTSKTFVTPTPINSTYPVDSRLTRL